PGRRAFRPSRPLKPVAESGGSAEMAVAERILHLRPDADTRPDRALVREAQHGRAEAATVLYQRYYPRIYSFVSHLTYGRANAEDLTQEVFVRALNALGRFNGQSRL